MDQKRILAQGTSKISKHWKTVRTSQQYLAMLLKIFMVDRLEFALYANIICCKRISSYLWKSPTEIIFLDNLCNQLGLRFWIKQDLHQKKNNQIIYLNIFCRNSVQFSNPAWDHRNYHWNESSEFISKRPTNGTL